MITEIIPSDCYTIREYNLQSKFHHAEFNGFRQFNLIAGKNGIGKTVLLECLRDKCEYKNVMMFADYFIISGKLKESQDRKIHAALHKNEIAFLKNEAISEIDKSMSIFGEIEHRNGSTASDIKFKSSNVIEDVLTKSNATKKMYLLTGALLALESGGVLLIDDIDFGLHYTIHKPFLKRLFELAIERDVQIFATTHSLEMITAYNKVVEECNYYDIARYFEMFEFFKNKELCMHEIDCQTLKREIY